MERDKYYKFNDIDRDLFMYFVYILCLPEDYVTRCYIVDLMFTYEYENWQISTPHPSHSLTVKSPSADLTWQKGAKRQMANLERSDLQYSIRFVVSTHSNNFFQIHIQFTDVYTNQRNVTESSIKTNVCFLILLLSY